MKHPAKLLLVGGLSLALGLPSISYATNGMFLIGQGTKSRGMGGVGIALPQDSIAGAMNPAGIGLIGSRADITGELFLPTANVELGGFKQESAANTFIMPAMGAAYKFNKQMTFGFSAIPAGGGGSRYNSNLYNNLTGADVGATLGVNLMVMQMAPTFAYRINKQHQVGFSPIFSIQTFRAFGLDYFSNFTSTGLFTDKLSNNGNDWSYGGGARIGWLGQFFNEKLSLGAVYTSTIHMKRFSKYEELFAEHGDIDTPENFGIGMAYKITSDLTMALDVTHIVYSDVGSIGNPSVTTSGSAFPNSQAENALGRDKGLGFGWSDQTVYKLGIAYDYNDALTFRAGWNYGKSPVDESNGEILFSIVAPAVVQNHLTLGATYNPSRNMELSVSYIHAFEHEQYGPTFIGSSGTLKMFQNAIGVSLGYKL